MGATLPAAARWVTTSPHGVSWIGFLYGGNTVGAVFGSMAAGFYLLRVYDLTVATLAAVAINAAIAAIAWLLAQRTASISESPLAATAETPAAGSATAAGGAGSVYLAIGISGLCALGAEVVWTRLLSLMLGATTYTFSMILGVFLSGLGIGSAAGAGIARSAARPAVVLAWCQLLLIASVAYAAWMLAWALPYWPINPSLAPSPWFTFQVDLTRCVWTVLPAALLWGASFPLALAAAATPGDDPARLVSRVYAANTLGAIGGALGFSLLVIPVIGTQHAQQLIVVLSALAGLLLLVRDPLFNATLSARGAIPPLPRGAATAMPRGAASSLPRGAAGSSPRRVLVASLAAVALAAAGVRAVPAVPGLLVAYGRYMVTWLDQVDVKYIGEGMNSSVAVTYLRSSGATQFHVSGKVEASTLPQDMRLQRMLAHLPALVHPRPRSVLVVGFGAGVTAGSFVPYPEVERLVICEIEPLIPQVVSQHFRDENNDVLNDRRTQLFYDDARSFILTTDEKFDVITSDPIHPWVKGAASLYTKEYFEAVKAHLNPGGVVTQWVPLYESTVDAVKSEIATFLEVFPNGTVWANNLNGGGYDLVLLAQAEPTRIDLNTLRARFADERYAAVAASLGQVGFDSPLALFSTFAGRGADLGPWLRDAVINRDRNLRLQYLAAVGFNSYRSEAIFSEIAAYRRFPDSLFVAEEAWLQRLRSAIPGSP
jgi:spermidine synthase